MSVVAGIIRQEIQRHGPMAFARFMELALYHPEGGYYERELAITGKQGDFATSVSVGPVFGELLATHFARGLETLDSGPLQLVEAGAHDGRLAADLLHHLGRYEPHLRSRLEYVIIEPSSRRRGWQKEALTGLDFRVRWLDSLAPLARSGVRGIIFSNELLDALPVHRFAWDGAGQTWREWGVGLADDRLVECYLPAGFRADTSPPDIPTELRAVLPDGYLVEQCPAASGWWSAAAQGLRQGWLVTFDYGWTRTERLLPERANGTLRAYSRHRVMDDLLAQPGEQDLTAHVDFTALQEAGEQAGLTTLGLRSQGEYLTRILAELEAGPEGRFPAWTPARRRQFLTLTHPQHFGRGFRVLEQHRDA